jgi:hypothetical protein
MVQLFEGDWCGKALIVRKALAMLQCTKIPEPFSVFFGFFAKI